MHKLLISFFAFFMMVSTAWGQVVETDLYRCKSQVEGFAEFTVKQVLDPAIENSKPQFAVKVDWTFDEIWSQSGSAKFLPDGTPVFQSQFEKKSLLPEEGLFPAPTRPTWEEEVLYIYVSINQSGTGSLSVKGDLAPIRCQKQF